jgi:hypothetical protein
MVVTIKKRFFILSNMQYHPQKIKSVGKKLMMKKLSDLLMFFYLFLIVTYCTSFSMSQEIEKIPSKKEKYCLRQMIFEESKEFITQQNEIGDIHWRGKMGFPSRILGVVDDKHLEKTVLIVPSFVIKHNSLWGYDLKNDIIISQTKVPFICFEGVIDKERWTPSINSSSIIANKGILVHMICGASGDIAINQTLSLLSNNITPIGWGMYKVNEGPGDNCLIQVEKKISEDGNNNGYYLNDRLMVFVRGNIAVRLQSYYKNFGCMDLARKIDTLLLEKAERQKNVQSDK